jgi:hypothetical protein
MTSSSKQVREIEHAPRYQDPGYACCPPGVQACPAGEVASGWTGFYPSRIAADGIKELYLAHSYDSRVWGPGRPGKPSELPKQGRG